MYGAFVSSLSVTAARAALPELLERVQRGEEVTITKHGRPVAVVVRPDTLRSRRADRAFAGAAEVARLLQEAGRNSAFGRPGLSAVRAQELVAELRSDRDRL